MAKNKGKLALLFGLISFILLVAPIGGWIIYKRDEYFASSVADKMSIGLIIALLFVVSMLVGAFKQIEKRITVVITLAIFYVLAMFLEPIIDDLRWVLLCALIGYVAYLPLWGLAKRDWNYHKVYNNEKVKIQARKEAEANADSTAIYM